MTTNQPKRCNWCTDDPLYIAYHDGEWGRPVTSDAELFERLVLEGMQAGLSWLTVLKKRSAMRKRFHNFDIQWLATKGSSCLQDWLEDAALIRHAGKLNAMVTNAQQVMEMRGAGESFSAWLWSFAPAGHAPLGPSSSAPTFTPEAKAMAVALKKRGFRFVGPTTCYAFMQSVGMVNDHRTDCHSYRDCARDWQHPLRPC